MTKLITRDVLLRHALKNIWSAPDPERQMNYRLAKLTTPEGAWRQMEIYWNEVSLPNDVDNFHVYQMGHLHKTMQSLRGDVSNVWINMANIAGQSDATIVVYNGNGLIVPLHTCHLMITNDGGTLVAISDASNGVIPGLTLSTDDVYLRVYTNGRYTKPAVDLRDHKSVISAGRRVKDRNDIVAMQNEIERTTAGYTIGAFSATVNGRYIDMVNTSTVAPGDFVDWTYDTTVTEIIDFKVSALSMFDSTLDNGKKYIISHDEAGDRVQYHDDIDVYLVIKKPAYTSGVLVHKRKKEVLRMLTHRDYSLAKSSVDAILKANGYTAAEAYIRFVYHDTGFVRKLVHEESRIHELYKLPHADRLKCMLGQNNAPQFWHARSLEKGTYVTVMGSLSKDLTRSMVEDAYGYNAMSTILGGTPSKAYKHMGSNVVDIPPGLQSSCTGYEYDKDGKLCGVSYTSGNVLYHCVSEETIWVELIHGECGLELDFVANSSKGQYLDDFNYRFYLREGGAWTDVTGTDQYSAAYNQWTFNKTASQDTLVLSNRRHLFRTFTKKVTNGVLQFDLQVRVNRLDVNAPIPLGFVDVFVNDHPLVDGVDVIVNWPTITITNKEYLIGGEDALQTIAVRAGGFCNPGHMQYVPPEDVGFMVNGVMSSNSRYDIHDDRVLSIVCAGAMYDRSEVAFAESSNGVSIADARNGYPYAIKDIVVPMNNYLVGGGAPNDSTYEQRTKAKAIDAVVSTYMGSRYPQNGLTAADMGGRKYHIYSPFFSSLLADLEDGYITDSMIGDGVITDAKVRQLCAAYVGLLDSDPLNVGTNLVRQMAIIDAFCFDRAVAITPKQRMLFDRVVTLYGGGIINTDGFVTTKS